ncbi:MAG: autotransporter outer membrane beta-barrel domain-containing protein [Ruegeria sp.]
MVWFVKRRLLETVLLVIVVLLGGSKEGAALGGSFINTSVNTPNGGQIFLFNDSTLGTAYVSLGGSGEFPGGSIYISNAPFAGSSVTAGGLASLGYRGATIISQNGADSTYASDGYMGVVFTARETAGGPLFRYEIALTGVTSTTVISSRTRINPTKPKPGSAETERLIQEFQNARATSLTSNQPELTKFLLRSESGAFDASVTRNAGYMNFSSDPTLPVWFDLAGNWSSQDDLDSSYALAVLGAHRQFNPNLLIGGMLQIDYAESEESVSNVDGTGWLVGPYVVAKLPRQPVYFEGRVLYGQANNEISPLGTYRDKFDSDRWLVQSRVTGEMEYGNLTLLPLFDLSYVSDDQKAYTDSLGVLIPDQDFSLTTARLGLDFSHPISVSRGEMTLTGGISGVWSTTSGTGTAVGVAPIGDTARGRADLGVDYLMQNSSTLSAGVFYDGIGESGFESYAVDFMWQIAF